MEKQLIRIKVSDLVPYYRNPRKIPQEAVDDVRESFRQCGVIDPIEIDENNVIHLRAKVYGIGALHLADYYTATITDPNGKTKTISMCALTYAQMAQTALMKELYQYYTYAQILR